MNSSKCVRATGCRSNRNTGTHKVRTALLLSVFLLAIFSVSSAEAASITTDRYDYPPGDSVIIYGYDFQPGELVTMQVTYHDSIPPTGPGQDPWDVVADGSGDFETYWIVPDSGYDGDTLLVEATGQVSGLVATTIFTDASTTLTFNGSLPGSVCPGTDLDVCATLLQNCAGGTSAPLEGRLLLFFITEGNCGVDVGQAALDSVLTDANGQACATIPIPTTPGDYAIRVKFRGEDKPGPTDPDNSACPGGEKVQLSNANVCEIVTADPAACNEPPTCTVPNDTTIFLCDLAQVCLPVSCDDPDGNLTPESPSVVSGPGTISGGTWCYTPTGPGVVSVTIRCEDTFGEYCEATFNVTFEINSAPVATCPGDQTMFVCDLSDICIDGFGYTDADGNVISETVSNGTLTGTQVCFTPVAGANTITYTVTDECGEVSTCTTTINVTLNSAPVATCPGDQTLFVCDLSDICIDGFGYTDADGNVTSETVSNGTLTGSQVCFTPVAGANTITYTVTDACGEVSTCTTTINVTLNSAPVATCPGDQTLFVCDLSDICIDGFGYTDADGNVTSETVSNGTLTGTQVCFTPVVGANTITYTVTDACGEVSTCTTTINVALNSAPLATCPGDQTLFVCDLSDICIDGFGYTDADGNVTSETVSNGTLTGTQVCFTPVAGTNTITYTVTDACGEVSTCTTTINVTLNSAPVATCPGDQTLFVCDLSDICIDGFGYTDADGNVTSETVSNGTLTGTQVCFTPVAGANTITYTVTDECGEVSTCTTTINVTLNSAPVATCPGDLTLSVCDLSDICIDGFGYTDADGNVTSETVSNGTLTGTQVCFTPVAGANTITYTVTDACGEVSTCTTTINVTLNSPPVATCPGDQTMFVCDLSDICIDGFGYTDADGNVTSETVSNGTLTGSQVCFTPVAGTNTITYTVTDECGEVSTCTTTINVTLNSPPVATCPEGGAQFVCDPGEVCVGGFASSDPDDNIASESVSIGTLVDGRVCFQADQAGTYEIVYTVVDECGESASCTTTVDLTFNEAPVYTNCPAEIVVQLGSTVTFDFSAEDPEGQDITYVLSPGSPGSITAAGRYTWTPGYNAICETEVTVLAVDECGHTSFCTFVVCVQNNPPVITCSDDMSDCWGAVFTGQVSATDVEGAPLGLDYSIASFNGPGTVDIVPQTGEFVWTSYESAEYIGTFELCIAVTDNAEICDPCSPSNADTCCIAITVVPSYHVWIEKKHGTLQGQFENVSIFIDSTYESYLMGGFNFLIQYDPSALSLGHVLPGEFIEECGWEYFTYRNGPSGNCGNTGCPSGFVRITAMADMNDGTVAATCWSTGGNNSGQLAELVFLVSNDRTLECQYVPIRFSWYECGDNAISSQFGDTLFISRYVYGYGNPMVSIENIEAPFPSIYGANTTCDVMDKGWPIRCSDFYNGGIDIICADSIDAPGDINLNGLPYEVSDAVMLTNYFVSGLSAFEPYVQGAIAASDVNGDGIPLSVADLVYLIRVIVGDALGYPKINPVEGNYYVGDGVVSIDRNIGAAHLILEGDVEPVLLADGMEMRYSFDGVNTRVLVYSLEPEASFGGEFLSVGDAELVSIEMATYDGAPVAARLVPREFDLAQNYPNPFNPTTNIKFSLPNGGHWSLTIFNVAGQVVERFEGDAAPGVVNHVWNAGDRSSGVYFYRLDNEGFSATRKMILLK